MWIAGCGETVPAAVVPEPTACAKATASLPDYEPSLTVGYVTLRDGRFAIGDTPFTARGVNYYPARYPWRRFLTEADIDTVRREFLLLRTAGFNSLRLFLWNQALFTCAG